MALQSLSVSAAWPLTPHFTAVAETSALVVNPNGMDRHKITWVVTEDDTVPSLDPALGAQIRPSDTQGMTLKTGERLWLAAPRAGADTLPATLMTGAA